MITLRQLEATDFATLAVLANNKNIWDQVRDYFPHPYSESDAIQFIEMTRMESPALTFAICYDGVLCGVSGLVLQKDVYRHSAELGYWIGEPFWGQGIATEAVRWMTEYAFRDLGLIRLFAGIFDFNTASMRVLEKCGFEKEGIARKAALKNGVLCDEHRYALLHTL